jgi:hypothetical protein
MHDVIKSSLATDTASWAPHQELIDYFAAPLEDVNVIVAWRGAQLPAFKHFWATSIVEKCLL